MSTSTGVYRSVHSSGLEMAFIDQGLGEDTLLGIPRERYESKGIQPPFDSLPEK